MKMKFSRSSSINRTEGMREASGGAEMHRSEAEGRFGEAEPEGRASVCLHESSGNVASVEMLPIPMAGSNEV